MGCLIVPVFSLPGSVPACPPYYIRGGQSGKRETFTQFPESIKTGKAGNGKDVLHGAYQVGSG